MCVEKEVTDNGNCIPSLQESMLKMCNLIPPVLIISVNSSWNMQTHNIAHLNSGKHVVII